MEPSEKQSSGAAAKNVQVNLGSIGVQNNYFGEFAPQAETLAPYFEHVAKASADIRLVGIDPKASDPNTCQCLQLANVYVALDTEHLWVPKEDEVDEFGNPPPYLDPEQAQQRPVSALEAVTHSRRVALTGRPGSGKTTFVRYLCLCFARHALNPAEGWIDKLKSSSWPDELLVPITIELRYFARDLPANLPATAQEQERSPQPRDLWDFFVRTTLKPSKLENLEPSLARAAAAGKALIVLEGLDEVPSGAQRNHVRQAILRFADAASFKASRFLVTCRSRAYEQKTLRLDNFTEAPLADFTEPKIRQFTEAWYAELARLDQKPPNGYSTRADRLYGAIRNPSLWPHAGRPMLLTVMANVHAKNDKLPKDRAQVYAEMVEILLESWDNVRLESLAPLRCLLEAARKDKKDLIRFLGEIAFEAHRRELGKGKSRDALADIPKHGQDGLLERLKEFCGSYDRADSLIEAIDQRAGLLVSPDVGSGVYQFPHRSFQEFLAGMHLANEPDFVQQAVELLNQAETEGLSGVGKTNYYRDDVGYWDEVLKWAAGVIAHVLNSPRLWSDVPALVGDLCDVRSGQQLRGHRLALAGEMLAEMGEDKLKDRKTRNGVPCLNLVREQLLDRALRSELSGKERAPFGILLGNLGDTRRGTGLRSDGLPDIVFEDEELRAGPFQLAGNRRKIEIERPYRISRYPVSVAQFQAFVDAGGYSEKMRHNWTTDGWEWKVGSNITGPKDSAPVFQTPNHPRVGVSWHEAMAFCKWLTEQLRQKVELEEDQVIRLPHEAEWEQAARWNKATKEADDRYFPWGGDKDDPDLAGKCNMGNTCIGHTSAVGMFPGRNAECGAADMSGNVWEWCENWYDEKEEYWVLRGGSWFYDFPESLSCSYRFGAPPVSRYDLIGFRCVLVGGSSAPG